MLSEYINTSEYLILYTRGCRFNLFISTFIKIWLDDVHGLQLPNKAWPRLKISLRQEAAQPDRKATHHPLVMLSQ